MRGYVKELVERYKEENGFNEVYGRFKDDIRKSFGGDNMAEGGEIKRAEIMLIDDDRGEYAIYDLDKKEFIEKGYSLSSEAEMDAKEMGYNEIDGVRVDGSTYAEGGNITYDLSDVI